MDGRILEARHENACEVFIVLDQKDVCRAVAVVQHAAELGEEEILVERLLHPALGVARKLRAKRGGENAEHDDWNVGRDGVVAESLQRLAKIAEDHEHRITGLEGGTTV